MWRRLSCGFRGARNHPAAVIVKEFHLRYSWGPEVARRHASKSLSADPVPLRRCKYTPLQVAAVNGSVAAVEAILALRPDAIQELTEAGETPLYLAVVHGQADMVRLLARRWPEGILQPVGESTPLLAAMEQGDVATVSALTLAQSLAIQGADRPSLLHTAAASGNLAAITLLAQQWPDAVSLPFKGVTPLRVVIERGDLAAAEALLEARPAAAQDTDPNTGDVPIHFAARRGHVQLVALLARMWPEGAAKCVRGDNSLHIACQMGHTAVAEVLLVAFPDLVRVRNIDDATTFDLAARMGHVDTVKLLMRFWPECATSSLKSAVTAGHPDVVRLLLTTITPETVDWFGWAFVEAIKAKRADMATILLESCSNEWRQRLNGFQRYLWSSALDAVKKRRAEMVGLLVKTFPQYITEWKSMAKYFIAPEQDKHGKQCTLLQMAAKNNDAATVKALLDACPPAHNWGEEVDEIFDPSRYDPQCDESVRKLLRPCMSRPRLVEWLAEGARHDDDDTVKAVLEAYPSLSDEPAVRGKGLCSLALLGRISVMMLLLSKSEDPVTALAATPGHDFLSPLECAIRFSTAVKIGLVLDAYPAAVSRASDKGGTPIFYAAMIGNAEMVEELLRRWPEGALHRVGTDLPLHTAIRGYHLAVIRLLLKAHPQTIMERSDGGDRGMMTTIFLAAIQQQSDDVVAELLQWWPEGALQWVGDSTPLLEAMARGHRSVVLKLLSVCPATAKQLSPKGATMVSLAVKRRCDAVFVEDLLRAWPEGARLRVDQKTLLEMLISSRATTAEASALALVKACPETAAETTADGSWMLHHAVRCSKPGMVSYLAQQYPDYILRCVRSCTPLLLAIWLNHVACAKALLDVRPAAVTDQTAEGRTTMFLAAELGHVGIIELLASRWPDGVRHRCDGMTPLHAAILHNRTAVVTAILALQPSAIDDLTAAGESPIHLAARWNRADIITALATQQPSSLKRRCM